MATSSEETMATVVVVAKSTEVAPTIVGPVTEVALSIEHLPATIEAQSTQVAPLTAVHQMTNDLLPTPPVLKGQGSYIVGHNIQH